MRDRLSCEKGKAGKDDIRKTRCVGTREEEDDQAMGDLSVLVEKGIRNPLDRPDRDRFPQWMGR